MKIVEIEASKLETLKHNLKWFQNEYDRQKKFIQDLIQRTLDDAVPLQFCYTNDNLSSVYNKVL